MPDQCSADTCQRVLKEAAPAEAGDAEAGRLLRGEHDDLQRLGRLEAHIPQRLDDNYQSILGFLSFCAVVSVLATI